MIYSGWDGVRMKMKLRFEKKVSTAVRVDSNGGSNQILKLVKKQDDEQFDGQQNRLDGNQEATSRAV